MPEHAADQQSEAHPPSSKLNWRSLFQSGCRRFDRSYGPRRSWQAFGQLLLRIISPL